MSSLEKKTFRIWMQECANRIEKKMNASQIMVTGFAFLILTGGVLLMLPCCNADGQWLSFIDALFTSCSAVCVTGLVTIVPAVQFTLPGKLILLCLIQLGGFGIIVCTMAVFLILKKQITLRSRVLIQESFNLNTMSGLISMLLYVITGTFAVELAGSVLYAIQFIPEFGFAKGVWYAVFHSVSTFCNAGIDILGDCSLQNYQLNPLVNGTAALLIIISGLGFIVWKDITRTIKRIIKKEASPRRAIQQMKLQSKLAIMVTLFLIAGGTLLIYLLEYNNPDTLARLSAGQKWMAAFFQSVTTRTAGFFTIPQNLFREPTKLLCAVLMFIGGCPGGTAGGVKTVTVAVLGLTILSVLAGKEDTECYRRKIPAANVRTAFSVFFTSLTVAMVGTFLISCTEGVGITTAMYEVVSAVATVGLTEGLTPILTTAGKLIIIFIMYLGRLSPVTLALLFMGKTASGKGVRKYPEERVMIG